MVIQSTRKQNSFFDEMKSRAFELYMMERQRAYETHTADDELSEALKISEDDYNFNLLKLDDLASLANSSEALKRRFIKQKLYIDQLDIVEKQKIESILTSACILKNFGVCLVNKNISEEELYLIARAMVNVETGSYSYYENLILTHLDRLVEMLRNVDGLTINHVKQYVKSKND